MDKVYTEEGIVAQCLIAFGQGLGAKRISHDAALELREHYESLMKIRGEMIKGRWENEGTHALEVVRTSGSKVAQETSNASLATVNNIESMMEAVGQVERTSNTEFCREE